MFYLTWSSNDPIHDKYHEMKIIDEIVSINGLEAITLIISVLVCTILESLNKNNSKWYVTLVVKM